MSADNWTTCPQCKKRAAAKAEELKRKAADAYGKVSEGDYQYLREQALKGPAKVPDHFREDYELFVTDDGVFCVSYHGWCEDCGWGLDYKHEHAVKMDDPAPARGVSDRAHDGGIRLINGRYESANNSEGI